MIDPATKPVCACHSKPMYWHKTHEYWFCAVKALERAIAYYWANRDKMKKRGKEYSKHYYAQKRGKVLERQHRRRAEQHADVREIERQYYQRNKDARAKYGRLRGLVLTDRHTRKEVFDRDEGICQSCGINLNPNKWHEDHIVPIALGGSDLLSNVRATCPPCNLRKGSKLITSIGVSYEDRPSHQG